MHFVHLSYIFQKDLHGRYEQYFQDLYDDCHCVKLTQKWDLIEVDIQQSTLCYLTTHSKSRSKRHP